MVWSVEFGVWGEGFLVPLGRSGIDNVPRAQVHSLKRTVKGPKVGEISLWHTSSNVVFISLSTLATDFHLPSIGDRSTSVGEK